MNTRSKAHRSVPTSEAHADLIALLRLAQTGDREQALMLADEQLQVAESPGMLYARGVALHSMGDHEGAAKAADRILALAPSASAQMTGWRAIGLAFRAWQLTPLSETNAQAFDLDSILRDLVRAEALLSDDVSDVFVLATAHTCLGNGYLDLRLYELAQPHFHAAFVAATANPDRIVLDRAVSSQNNLAAMHLNWAMELLRIGDSVGAREKSAIAAWHAANAQEYAATDEAHPYAEHAGLLLACADSSHMDDKMVVARIRDRLTALKGRGNRESRAFALPFLARALDRAGQHTEALKAAQEACTAVPEDATWMVATAAHHTLAALLAQSGSDAARAAMAYGDRLAKSMWGQRLRTLRNVTSMQFVERVTLERDRVQVLANTDALTGVGNRRAFDDRMAELGTTAADVVALIVVDVDRLKAVNDAGGHEAGDRALKAIAHALTSQLRAGDLIARVGGDEFVAVLEGMDRTAAADVAARMVEAVSAALGSTVTVSLGIATGPPAEAGPSLLRAADRAMYAAKRKSGMLMSGAHPVVEGQSLIG